MELLKYAVTGFVRGVYDSIVGMGVVVTLQAEQNKSAARKSAEATTTLALRRAAVLQTSLTLGASASTAELHHQLQDVPAKSPSTPQRIRREEPRLIFRIFQCCFLNGGIFIASLVFFDRVLLPAVLSLIELLFGHSQVTSADSIWSWLRPLLVCTFQALWVLPLFLLSKVVNSLWFQDIADIAFRYITGGRQRFLPSVSRVVSDVLFSVLVQTLFLIQSLIVGLPGGWISDFVSLVHLSMLYSLYSFEYTWFSRGWELHRRLSFIEENWPYFVGFGLPLAVITSWCESYFLSGSLFSILFPLFILSASGVTPATGTTTYALKLFSPSIWVSNAIFHRLTANCAAKPPARPAVPRQKRSATRELHKKSASPRMSRPRTATTPS
uniref:Etoposide-induced 2.4 mRNA n=1 Tax=Rhipicephalus zambeziensis TaxID=60191 RepID=A0A224YMH1_9ACAR